MPVVTLVLNELNRGHFYLYEDDQQAGEMDIQIDSMNLTVYHTGVAEAYDGKGYAKLLLDAMVAEARKRNIKVIPLCPYVHAQFLRHPREYADLWEKESPDKT